ncbi:WD40 repeat domain-containing protein [Rubritalea tangerina]|uniref:WD40 repeat domain-containing protein n=2 Tax=Rubritalea tangerina TaxID=430798 RepID=A0ABW4ZFJ4_9BACT
MLDLNESGKVLWRNWRQASTHSSSVCLSADGTRIFLGTENGHIEVLDSKDGALLKTFVWRDSAITSLAVHESGALFVSGNESGEVVMWGMNHLRPVGPWIQISSKVDALDFLKDGVIKVVGGQREQRWQYASLPVYGFNNATSMKHEFFMLTQRKNGNGVFGMKASNGKKVWVDYKANKEAREKELTEINWKPVRGEQLVVAESYAGWVRRVYVENNGQSVRVEVGDEMAVIGPLSEVNFVDLLYDGMVVVTGSRKGEVRLWEAASGQAISPTLKNLFPVQDIRLNSEIGHMAVVTEGYLPVWKVQAEGRSLEELDNVIGLLTRGEGHIREPLNEQEVQHWIRHQNSMNMEFRE